MAGLLIGLMLASLAMAATCLLLALDESKENF